MRVNNRPRKRVKLLRDARVTVYAGDTVWVPAREAACLVAYGSAVRVADEPATAPEEKPAPVTAEEPTAEKTPEKKPARKARKTK